MLKIGYSLLSGKDFTGPLRQQKVKDFYNFLAMDRLRSEIFSLNDEQCGEASLLGRAKYGLILQTLFHHSSLKVTTTYGPSSYM